MKYNASKDKLKSNEAREYENHVFHEHVENSCRLHKVNKCKSYNTNNLL